MIFSFENSNYVRVYLFEIISILLIAILIKNTFTVIYTYWKHFTSMIIHYKLLDI